MRSTTAPRIFPWLSLITCEGWAALPPGTAAWQGIFFQAIYSASHYQVTNRAKLTRKESSLLLSLLSKEFYFTFEALLLHTLSTLKVLPAWGFSPALEEALTLQHRGAAPVPKLLPKRLIVLLESSRICGLKVWRYSFFSQTFGEIERRENYLHWGFLALPHPPHSFCVFQGRCRLCAVILSSQMRALQLLRLSRIP